MSEKGTYTDFRVLLRRALSSYNTQNEFANAIGINPVTLSKMLTSDEISRPAKLTLKKIANGSKGRITFDELMKSCGYSIDSGESVTKTDILTALQNLETVCMKEYCKVAMNSVDEYMETVIRVYSPDFLNVKAENYKTYDARDSDKGKGSKVDLIILTTDLDDTHYAVLDVLVYYYQTIDDKVIVMSTESDLNALVNYNSETAFEVLQYKEDHPNEKVDSTHDRVLVKDKLVKRKRYEPLQPEERLLKALFGNETGRKAYKEKIQGIGFYISEQLPEFAFKHFLENHKKTFCNSVKEKKMYSDYIENGVPRDKVFLHYSTDTASGAGTDCWLAAIVNIIYRETSINVQGWLNNPNENYFKEYEVLEAPPKKKDYNNRSCILFPKAMPWEYNEREKELSYSSLKLTLDKYARELKTEVSSCVFIATVYA